MATQTATLDRAIPARRSSGIWRDALGRLMRNRLAVVGGIWVIFLLFLGVFGPLIAPWHYDQKDNIAFNLAHGRPVAPFTIPNHLLGLDNYGLDIFSKLLDGAQISMSVAFVAQAVVLLIGIPVGALAGWYGGRVDSYLMRFTDVMYAFPDLLLIILLSVAFRDTDFGRALNGLFLVFVAIGLTSWVTVARLVRGQLLSLRETEFVEAARAIGVSGRKIMTRHLLPNAIGPVTVAVTLGIPTAILFEATLAYLGVGVQPPRASWGKMIAEGVNFIRSAPYLTYLPGLMIASALISFTFLGDGLRDALDPKLKGKQ
jgi:oligopeptide transport system permease protein